MSPCRARLGAPVRVTSRSAEEYHHLAMPRLPKAPGSSHCPSLTCNQLILALTGDKGTGAVAGRGGGSSSCKGHSAGGEKAGLYERLILKPLAAKQSIASVPISRAQS